MLTSIKKILIPIDFSPFSLFGVEYAASIAKLFDAQIFLLHVLPRSVFAAPYPNIDLNSETVLRDKATEVKTALDNFIRNHLNDVPTISAVVTQGEPYKEIVKFAHENQMDLIVITTHGRTGAAHLLMGSVAEKVVRYSTVPVLTLKPQAVLNHLLETEDVEEQLHLKAELRN